MSRTRRGRGGRGHQTHDAHEMTWFRMDLHLHTPASADYQDLSATYLEILQKAEERGLDIVAFTDHNSVSGIAAMRREIEDLELLEELDRLMPAERNILDEYRRLLGKFSSCRASSSPPPTASISWVSSHRRRPSGGLNIC